MKRLICMAPDGEYVTHKTLNTIQECWEETETLGSRWIFYPLTLVATRCKIVDAPDGFEWMKGKHVKTVSSWLAEHPQYLPDMLS